MYRCRVEAHSAGPLVSQELISFVIEFPRCVLAETVTHRLLNQAWDDGEFTFCERTTTLDLSKNSASSRAIPFSRMAEKIRTDPYMPQWTLNQSGMQGNYATDPALVQLANDEWLRLRNEMLEGAEYLHALGIHKQDCNRLLEPWGWVTQLITGTRRGFDNFFALRCHVAAFPPFRHIARMMYLALRKSTPERLCYGQWHLPFVKTEEKKDFFWEPDYEAIDSSKLVLPDLIQFSAARCGWISYANHDKDGTPEQMKKTFARFVAERPIHASPVESQATPMRPRLTSERLRSNLDGWLQARKLLPYECAPAPAFSDEEIASWGIDENNLWPERA